MTVGAASGAGIGAVARSTTADRGGTVTSSVPSADAVGAASVPWTGSNAMPGDQVGTEADFSASALLSTTTYSVAEAASMRDRARTPAPASAWRTTWAPSDSAGCASRRADRAAMCAYRGWFVS